MLKFFEIGDFFRENMNKIGPFVRENFLKNRPYSAADTRLAHNGSHPTGGKRSTGPLLNGTVPVENQRDVYFSQRNIYERERGIMIFHKKNSEKSYVKVHYYVYGVCFHQDVHQHSRAIPI